MKGIYTTTTPDHLGGWVKHRIKVEVLGETERSLRVKLLEPGPGGVPVGTVKWVRRRSVTIKEARPVPRDLSQNRLPYID